MSEAAILWIMGITLGVVITFLGWVAYRLDEHLRDCTRRWNQLLQEHGRIQATQEVVVRAIERLEGGR